MKIAILGYGNMGKAIEAYCQKDTDHEIVLKIGKNNQEQLTFEQLKKADVAIDFSLAESAVKHILTCFEANIPVVSGTTGWLHDWETVANACKIKQGTLLYSSNFSIGVHLFWKLIHQAGELMNTQDYALQIDETHHTKKKDAPSGTAITTAEQLIKTMQQYQSWSLEKTEDSAKIPIFAHRINDVPGTHRVTFDNEIDTITIEHKAKSRLGFVQGAVKAAEFVIGKEGLFTLDDLLK